MSPPSVAACALGAEAMLADTFKTAVCPREILSVASMVIVGGTAFLMLDVALDVATDVPSFSDPLESERARVPLVEPLAPPPAPLKETTVVTVPLASVPAAPVDTVPFTPTF